MQAVVNTVATELTQTSCHREDHAQMTREAPCATAWHCLLLKLASKNLCQEMVTAQADLILTFTSGRLESGSVLIHFLASLILWRAASISTPGSTSPSSKSEVSCWFSTMANTQGKRLCRQHMMSGCRACCNLAQEI